MRIPPPSLWHLIKARKPQYLFTRASWLAPGRRRPEGATTYAAEGFVQADRDLRRDSPMTIDKFGELLAAGAQLLDRIRYAEAQRLTGI